MAERMDLKEKTCVTPEFRLSYPTLFKARAFNEGDEAKYSCVMLFDKKTDFKTPVKKGFKSMSRAALNAKIEKFGKDKEKWKKMRLKSPFRDGSEREGTDGYGEGVIFVSASSKNKIGIVGPDMMPITDESEIYAGCYCRAHLVAYPFDVKGNRGVAFGLRNIQKVRDGEPFSSAGSVDDVFDAVEDVSDNPDNYEVDDEDFEI